MGPKEVVLMDQEERVARFGVLCTGPTRRDANGVVIEQDGIFLPEASGSRAANMPKNSP